jgi:glycosyltransferase involved in cell wall biosynthesis
MRAGAVEHLNRYFNVKVITVGSHTECINEVEVIGVPFNHNQRLMFWRERIGFIEDFLLPWAKSVYEYLVDKVTSNDVIFCTTGGELSTIIIGYWLKKHIGCPYVVNFRDPLIYSKVNGIKIDKKFHVSRERSELKYLSIADLIVTSSKSNEESLKCKYPHLEDRILNNYFGFVDECKVTSTKSSEDILNLVYGGRFGPLQAPEIFAKACMDVKNVNLYFIGDYTSYKPIWPYTDKFIFLKQMEHSEYQDFLIKHIDVGLLSLSSDYLGACVPAKFYEYINLGLPMLGALPNGDARQLINEKKYGFSCDYRAVEEVRKGIYKFQKKIFLNSCRNNIMADRLAWSMETLIQELVNKIKSL